MPNDIVGPDSEGVDPIQNGDEVFAQSRKPNGERISQHFIAQQSPDHLGMIELTEVNTDSQNPASGLMNKESRFQFDLIPDAIIGERGKKFLAAIGGLAAVAAAGGTARWLIKRKKNR